MRLLYLIWMILPATLFLCFLWSVLEGRRKGKTGERGDLWRSTIHTTIVVTIAVVIHHYGILPLLGNNSNRWQLRTLIDVATLPLALIIGAKLLGPSPVSERRQSTNRNSSNTKQTSITERRR